MYYGKLYLVALFNKKILDSPPGSYSLKEHMCNRISVVASSRIDGLIKHSVGFGDRSISAKRWRGRDGVQEIHDKPLRKFEVEGGQDEPVT